LYGPICPGEKGGLKDGQGVNCISEMINQEFNGILLENPRKF
jgi:hypothetical protein